MNKLGFACKWIDSVTQVNGIKSDDDCRKYNTGTTTVAWLKRQSRAVAEERLWDLMRANIESVRMLVERVGQLEERFRMVRLGSDILPVYTQADYKYFWQLPDVVLYAERAFQRVGEIARAHAVRLSFHPGQFTVLASENPGIVERSIAEFEYHADMARMMGYGKTFQDFKINVHISGKRGPEGIRDAYRQLSQEARNCITIENEENSWGLDDALTLHDLLPIVLDIHHNWIREGEYIQASDPRIEVIQNSWRGVRPVAHYSISREDVLTGHSTTVLPDRAALIATGYKKQHMRAHSDFYWNTAVNTWALTHNEWADIMCEAKGKNLASVKFGSLQ